VRGKDIARNNNFDNFAQRPFFPQCLVYASPVNYGVPVCSRRRRTLSKATCSVKKTKEKARVKSKKKAERITKEETKREENSDKKDD